MIHQFYNPVPALNGYIKNYLLLHFKFDRQAPVPPKIYPVSPEQGFTFYVRGCCVAETPELGFSEKRPRSVIWGQTLHKQYMKVNHNDEYVMINVCFYPGALFKLFQIPMTEFLHKNVDAEAVFGRELWDTNEKLANAKTYTEMISIVNGFFVEKLRKLNHYWFHPIEKIPMFLMQNPNGFSLSKLAHDACLSNSQFERKFTQQVGITPKLFARICRFEQAYSLKQHFPNLDWLSIAIQTGYNDYQHLVKDFKQFSGFTPTILLNEQARSPEKYLGLI